MLRVRMKGRETVFELNVAKRDAREACAEHVQRFGREMVPTGRKLSDGKDEYALREVPRDLFIFEWVEGAGTKDETTEPVLMG